MKFEGLIALSVLLLLIFSGLACHRVSYGADDKSKPHIGIVFDIGGKDDRSFNAAAWAGVKCAETGKRPDRQPCLDDRENPKAAFDIVLRDVEPGNTTSI